LQAATVAAPAPAPSRTGTRGNRSGMNASMGVVLFFDG
jgi:hypothetical protein